MHITRNITGIFLIHIESSSVSSHGYTSEFTTQLKNSYLHTKIQQNQDTKKPILKESEDNPLFCKSQSYMKAHFVLGNDMFN